MICYLRTRTKTVFWYAQVNLKTFRYFIKDNVLWCAIKSLYNDKVNLRDLNLGKKKKLLFFWLLYDGMAKFYFGKGV